MAGYGLRPNPPYESVFVGRISERSERNPPSAVAPEEVLLHLAGLGARQARDRDEVARELEAREALGAPAAQRLRVERAALARDDERAADLAPALVGDAYHGDLAHVGVLRVGRLHLGRVDVLAARDVHVPRAAD